MPNYTIGPLEFDIPRKAFFLDTNVLVAAFLPKDKWHDNARLFLDESPDLFIVPLAVIVETWGLIVGSVKRRDLGMEFLAWIKNPGNALVIPLAQVIREKGQELCESAQIDLVDALLVCLAHEINVTLKINPKIPIASLDGRDYCKCWQTQGVGFSFFDVKTLDIQF